MNETSDKDALDALLHEQSTYVADEGFTRRVLQSLPRRRTHWLRHSFLLCTSAIGSIVAVWWLPWGNLPPLNMAALASMDSKIWVPWITAVLVIGCLVWSMVAALQWED